MTAPVHEDEVRLALLEAFARRAPQRVADLLQQADAGEAAGALAGLPPAAAGTVLASMPPAVAARLLPALPADRFAAISEALELPLFANLLRYLDAAARKPLFRSLSDPTRAGVERLLSQSPDRVGAHVDPRVVALHVDTAVGDALASATAQASGAVEVLFAIDSGHLLVGVVAWHELLRARPGDRVGALATPAPSALPVDALVETALADAGWARAATLPVIDPEGRLAGALRHDALVRARAEHLSHGAGPSTAKTASELAGLYSLGLSALWRWFGDAGADRDDPEGR